MPRFKRRKTAKESTDDRPDKRQKGAWENVQPWKLESTKFQAYYQAQKLMEEGEWETFLKYMRTPLPAAFRIARDCPFAEKLHVQVSNFVGKKLKLEDMELEPFKQLTWFPGIALQLGCDKRVLRKSEELESFHQWLINHTGNGNITRQETVSMIPPIFLDVQPHHTVLDMCASPGSKTSQMLEIIESCGSEEPEGLVVANDVDVDRAFMLVHQCRRISGSTALCVTCHRAQFYPNVLDKYDENGHLIEKAKEGMFDRILADVPCSGDGTLRKQPMIWKKWTPKGGNALHLLQLQIATRGAILLKQGGLMVYSTCSLNPIENEAVIAELLRRCNGSLELVDVSSIAPGLRRRNGMSHWEVFDEYPREIRKQIKFRQKKRAEHGTGSLENNKTEGDEPIVGEEPKSHQDPNLNDVIRRAIESGFLYYRSMDDVPSSRRKTILPTFFPPQTEEEINRLQLERCMRFLPQDQDTGGFFVAVLRKTAEMDFQYLHQQISIALSFYGTNQKINDDDKKVDNLKDIDTTEGNNIQNTTNDVIEGSNDNEKNDEVNEIDNEIETKDVVDDDDDDVNERNENKSDFAREEILALLDDNGDEVVEKNEEISQTVGSNNNTQGGRKSRKELKEATFKDLIPIPKESWENIKETYGISDTFPVEHLYVKNEIVRVVYYLSKPVQELLAHDKTRKLRIENTGLKIFERNSKLTEETKFRLVHEAIRFVLPYISKQIVWLIPQDFEQLFKGGFVNFSEMTEESQEQLLPYEVGSLVCVYKSEEHAYNIIPSRPFAIIAWRGKADAINVMCCQKDLNAMKELLQMVRSGDCSTKK